MKRESKNVCLYMWVWEIKGEVGKREKEMEWDRDKEGGKTSRVTEIKKERKEVEWVREVEREQ